MESAARLLESASDRYAQRQTSSMALSGSLSSGHSYYTVESLEGASSLPPLKPSFAASDHDSLLGLDARTRALLADRRDAADARARLLAAERENLLRREEVLGAPSAERRPSADGGLTSLDSRFDGILPLDAPSRHSFDDLQGFDPRTRALGLDRRSEDVFRPGIDDRARSFAPPGGREQGLTDQRPDLIRARELAAARNSFLPSTDYLPGRRDSEDVRSPALPAHSYSSFPRRDFLNTAEGRALFEAGRKLKRKRKVWCGVCKIDCVNAGNLASHVSGKKHKAMVEGKLVNPKEPSDEGKSTPAMASQAEKKRVSDAKPEALPGAKRLKALVAAVENGALVKAADSTMGKDDEFRKEKPLLTCEICNVFTTGQFNLDAHLKGRRHAARVRELFNSQVAK